MANSMIPLSIKTFDLANSLNAGVKVANSLFGEPMSAADEARLAQSAANQLRAQSNSDRSFAAAERRHGEAVGLSRERFEWEKSKPKSVFEQVRAKIAAGQPLTPGESQIKTQMEKGSALEQLLRDSGEGTIDGSPPAEPATVAPEAPVSGGGAPSPLAGLSGSAPSAAAPRGELPVFQMGPDGKSPVVSSPADIAKLPPGTKTFYTPDGRLKVVPGA